MPNHFVLDLEGGGNRYPLLYYEEVAELRPESSLYDSSAVVYVSCKKCTTGGKIRALFYPYRQCDARSSTRMKQ